jgi:small ligand-binding sensory domain FIST
MRMFPSAHATHPQWQLASALVLAQIRGQLEQPTYAQAPTLGLLYITDHYAGAAADILEYLSAELPFVTDWSGTVGVAIASNNVEYYDEPALALMLLEIPGDQYRVFSGVAPLGLGFHAHTALVHADPRTLELTELIEEMALRTDSGYVFGGLSSSRSQTVQFAVTGDGNISGHGHASGVFSGGLSGVAFAADVGVVSRVTQGCKPLGADYLVTEVDRNVVLSLNGEPALDVMLRELGVSLDRPQEALSAVRQTLVGLERPKSHVGHDALLGGVALQKTGSFGGDVVVRHIVGLDPARRGIALSDWVEANSQATFCQRNMQSAKADLIRVCAEIREELEPLELPMETAMAMAGSSAESSLHPARRIAGAIYISCSGRGGPHFGAPSAELHIVRKALGDVPLVGFFAAGEIAFNRVYGYTGVLTVFTTPDS